MDANSSIVAFLLEEVKKNPMSYFQKHPMDANLPTRRSELLTILFPKASNRR